MTVVLASALTFAAVFFGIFALNLMLTDVFRAERSDMRRRTQSRRQRKQRDQLREELREQERAAGGLGELARQLEMEKDISPWERFTDFVAQSGLRLTAAHVVAYGLLWGVTLFAITYFLFGVSVACVLLTIIGLLAPVGRVAYARHKRLSLLRQQLPDALELIGRVLRAGQTIVQAMNSIGEEYGDPIGTEFSRCYEQQNLGLSLDVALRDLAKRTGLIEIKIFVLAVLIHRQAGGNLTELLERLARMVRQRLMLRGEIRSLTAEGRMQAVVLVLLPMLVWLALSGLNPDYAFELFQHPGLVVATLSLVMVGAVWINRIVNFDF